MILPSFLYLQGKVGMDWYSRKTKSLVPQGTGYQIGGAAVEGLTKCQGDKPGMDVRL